MLTEKAKIDFFEWLYSEYDYSKKEFVQLYPKTLGVSLIIEWFDTVKININISYVYPLGYFNYFIHKGHWTVNETAIDNRYNATKKAIIRANKIYNEIKITIL